MFNKLLINSLYKILIANNQNWSYDEEGNIMQGKITIQLYPLKNTSFILNYLSIQWNNIAWKREKKIRCNFYSQMTQYCAVDKRDGAMKCKKPIRQFFGWKNLSKSMRFVSF